jgi:hypothetical protein
MQNLFFSLFVLLLLAGSANAQISSSNNQDLVLDPVKVAQFEPYVTVRHAYYEPGGYSGWKADNPEQYLKEMWYWSESFYFKKDYLSSGTSLPGRSIDISRFERKRKPNEEVIIVLPGFKDALVLLPSSKLIYKPIDQ